MSAPQRCFSLLAALLGLGLGASPASAQVPGSYNPYNLGANPLPYNTANLGANRPLGPGYAPVRDPYNTNVPSAPEVTGSPYAGSTGPSYNGSYGGYGYPSYNPSIIGGQMQGQAALTAATGQYLVNTSQAQILREQSRQASIDTQRQRLNFEMQYEDIKNARARQNIENQRFAVLDRARRNPSDVEIWEGKTLNVLLKSVLMSPSPGRGPNIDISQATLRGLNLTNSGYKGSLALAKDEGKIDWTDALMDSSFDTVRKRFSTNFADAMKEAQTGKRPDRAMLSDLKSDLKTLASTLDNQVGTLSPDIYIESRRVLNKLKSGIAGLSDSRVVKSCNCTWKKDVRTVAQLVSYCQNNGLEFSAAAASGDQVCYQVVYYALRSYERGVTQLASARE